MNDDEQAEYWSGKKKRHTVKNMVLIDEQCRIRFLGVTYPGKWHDKALLEDEAYCLPAGSWLYQDRGFQGFTVQNVVVRQPTKKPKGGELSEEQKAENRRIASEKMRIEHTMSSVKRCTIVKEVCRYWQDRVRDMVMQLACGLHTFRLRFRPWNYNTT